jgi:putative CRISPR-associated protein (TIGR02619 family)
MTTILTTTGISLYLNTGRTLGTKTPTEDQMRQYLRMNPNLASSEANSLLRMADHDDHLVLLHTKTPEAIQCVKLLQNYFQNEGYKYVRLEPLEFESDPKHVETTGLRNLINALINEIKKAQDKDQQVVINATAGFKAQVVYSTMIGMIYQVPVKYIYEDFKTIVTFNPIAIDWNTSLFLTYDAFFSWFDAEPRTQKEVEHYLKDCPDRERINAFLTSPDTDGEVFLTYMGNALYQKFQDEKEDAALVEWPPVAEIKKIEDKIASSIRERKHHPVKGDLNACRKIATLDYVREITGGFYEPTTRSAVKLIDPDEGVILLLWADDEKAARFTINTTAKGKPQTLKVAQKIKEILEIT